MLGLFPIFSRLFPVVVYRSIMTDLYYLSQTDGAGDWREKEAKDLTDLVQRRITYLQVGTIQLLNQGKLILKK